LAPIRPSPTSPISITTVLSCVPTCF